MRFEEKSWMKYPNIGPRASGPKPWVNVDIRALIIANAFQLGDQFFVQAVRSVEIQLWGFLEVIPKGHGDHPKVGARVLSQKNRMISRNDGSQRLS